MREQTSASAAYSASLFAETQQSTVDRQASASQFLANLACGYVTFDELQKPRFFLRAANWLHLNRGKKAWTYVADSYAGALLLLAMSGMFMIAGKKGFFGRGAVFVALGIAIPVLYVTLASP